jgi:hypothetical protein
MSVTKFCYTASYRVMAALHQELGLSPGVHYRPSGYNSARVMSLRLAGINPHYLPTIINLRDQLTMWAGLDDKSKIRVGWTGTTILLEIPKPPQYWKRVTIEILEQRRMIRRGLVVTLGLGLQDDPKRINFKEAALAHVFITGQTRSGKTNAQKLIGWNLVRNTTPDDARMIIFDVAKRGYKWRDFNNVPHLIHPVVTDLAEADRALAWISAEIDRRAENDYTKPKLFCLIDELKAFTDDSPLASNYLARIAGVGGEFGLHLILATQYPQVKMLGSAELKRNITTRLCGKVDDATAAANALGITGSGAESLQGYGDFLLKDFDGLSRLTVAKIEAHHIDQLPRGETKRLDLPEIETANNGPRPSVRQPDPLEPEQVALALFEPMGNTRLGKQLGVGSGKAKRINHFARNIRSWALANGYNCLETINRTDEKKSPNAIQP